MRNFEIVGEATKNLSAALRGSCPEIPWARMAGMRDLLIHNYMGVDLEVVWGAVEDEISPLNAKLLALLEESGEAQQHGLFRNYGRCAGVFYCHRWSCYTPGCL